jgi:hypothetical protein
MAHLLVPLKLTASLMLSMILAVMPIRCFWDNVQEDTQTLVLLFLDGESEKKKKYPRSILRKHPSVVVISTDPADITANHRLDGS